MTTVENKTEKNAAPGVVGYGFEKDMCAVCGCIIENGRTYCPAHEPGADE